MAFSDLAWECLLSVLLLETVTVLQRLQDRELRLHPFEGGVSKYL